MDCCVSPHEQRLLDKIESKEDIYRSLIVRIAGYSAYFCDLSPDLQNDLIARTEHEAMS